MLATFGKYRLERVFYMDIKEQNNALLKRGKAIISEEDFRAYNGRSRYSLKAQTWLNDVNLFSYTLPESYPMRKEIQTAYFLRNRQDTLDRMISFLESISSDTSIESFVTKEKDKDMQSKKYDVFISHASKDKSTYVNALCSEIKKLGINVFYDKDVFDWGDNWKQKIYEGTEQAEFAIIVISENFFGREWTEIELKQFLERQNACGQKIVLPLLYNISIEELKRKYPMLADIQCLDAKERSKKDICILFAKELIKRLKGTV